MRWVLFRRRSPSRPRVILFALGLACLGFDRGLVAETSDAPPGRRDSLTALLEDYRTLEPDSRGIAVRDRTVQVGHLDLLFENGTIFPLKSRRGEVLGLYFDGRGRYTYRSVDPTDRLVIEANVAHQTSAPLYYQFAVRDTLQRAVLFFAAPILQSLQQEGAPDGGSTPEISPHSRSAFGAIWKRIELTYLAHEHLAAEARLNPIGLQYVYAEMEGGRETVGYSYDGTDDYEERLFFFHKPQGVDARFVRVISEQPIDGGEASHPPHLRLRDAQLDVETDDNRTATITSDLTFEATIDGLAFARLSLMNNRDPRHYDWASEKNRLEVKRVIDEAGHDLPFSHRYHEMLLQLPRPLRRGETTRLHFEAAGAILTALNGERHDNYIELMYEPWYPQPFSRRWGGWTFTLKVRTRKPFVPIAAGATLSFREVGDFYELVTGSTRPAAPIVLFAGRYKTNEQKFEDLTIRAHAYAMGAPEALEKLPRLAHQFLSFYEDHLGPYPFGDLNIVEAPGLPDSGAFLAFGMAPPGLVLITSEAYTARRTPLILAASQGVNQRLAHEIAHQWFPHQAWPDSPRDAWLSESFAQYLSGLALATVQPDEPDRVGFPYLFKNWQSTARSCKDAGSIEAANMLRSEDAWEKRECLLYNRGPLVLHMLRAMAGDDRFFAILRLFLKRANMGNVTTDDFRRAAEEVLQMDLTWFFDDWYRKGGIPEIRMKYEVTPADGGRFALAGRAEQAEGPGFRRILIPLVVDYGEGRREVRLVFQEKPVQPFRFELGEKPKKVSVDPGQNNLAVYR